VREWPNRRAWKARVLETGPWVQIPPSPPLLGATGAVRCQGISSGAPAYQPAANDEHRKAVSRGAAPIPKGNVAKRYGGQSQCRVGTWRVAARRFVIWYFYRAKSESEGAGPCATSSCEPRQVRKEATVSRSVCVPQDHLAPLFIAMLKQVHRFVLPSKKSSTYRGDRVGLGRLRAGAVRMDVTPPVLAARPHTGRGGLGEPGMCVIADV
jgi:hypothetical protein